MSRAVRKLSLAEFLEMPASCDHTELINGEMIPKVSPKYKHASIQGKLLCFLADWCDRAQCGRVLPEWAIVLQRQGIDWVPVPDLTYVSYERLPANWEEDAPCPVLPELVIEIISPSQSFGEMTSKAMDYLQAGVSRVWVIDNQAQSVTVFGEKEIPQTFGVGDIISDALLPGLKVTVAELFAKRGDRANADKS